MRWLAHFGEPPIGAAVCAPDGLLGRAVSDTAQISRVAEYRNQAAMLRSLAFQTRFAESRARLLALADSFDRLADRVEGWKVAANAAN